MYKERFSFSSDSLNIYVRFKIAHYQRNKQTGNRTDGGGGNSSNNVKCV